MIAREDIKEFFNLEADALRKTWESLMKLPVKDRIRKRKAIADVFLDKENYGMSPEQEYLLKVTFKRNLSDFKEGECLILHKEEYTTGIKCTLNTFVDDNNIMVSVFPTNMPHELKNYYDVPLLLDKDCVDLRSSVYFPFTSKLPIDREFWENNILNTQSTPEFEDEEKNEEELQDTIQNFKLNITDKQHEAIVKCMSAKDYYLVQGPPGTGKSFVLSFIILEEVLYFKHKVIVIGPNHMAINNTLEAVVKATHSSIGHIVKVGQSYNAPTLEVIDGDEKKKIFNVQKASYCNYGGVPISDFEEPLIIGMTPHSLYTSRGREMKCDTLVIDEAGQMTIPLAMMGMLKAKKVIFAGDYKQLPPIVTSEEVKDEMKQSAFQKLITDANCTMLDVSFRMCEPICNYVSELFYDGKVKANKRGCGDMVICTDPQYSFNSPIIINNVDDDGEQISDKEAEFITELINTYIVKYDLPPSEIAVLSPFRAQAANVRRHIRKSESLTREQCQQISVDTVDKMQGQEREVIIFSMTAGNSEYVADMSDFLYNPNKLNVAFSRAKSKLIIVGNMDEIKEVSQEEFPHIQKMINSELVKIVKSDVSHISE